MTANLAGTVFTVAILMMTDGSADLYFYVSYWGHST